MDYIPIISIVLSIIAIGLNAVAFVFKKTGDERIIQESCDLAERAQSLNEKNGNKLSGNDKKRIAMDHAKQRKIKLKDAELSNRIQAQLERRKRNA